VIAIAKSTATKIFPIDKIQCNTCVWN